MWREVLLDVHSVIIVRGYESDQSELRERLKQR
jgi:hypothetical protein